MGLQDLIITPIFLLLLYFVAFAIRSHVSNSLTRKYFIPGLTVKFIGAISLGIIYQFYYDGGDTFNYHTHGSRWIWEAIMNNPLSGMTLLFNGGNHLGETFEYSSQILFFTDPSSYFVVKTAAILDLFTYGTYSSTALLFAALSFSGLWAMFCSFHELFPKKSGQLAAAILFVPSVFFWGSGILKDSITMGALGWSTYFTYNLLIFKRKVLFHSVLLILSLYVLFIVKIYILLCFLPSIIILAFSSKLNSIKNTTLKVIISPFIIIITISLAYYSMIKVSEDNPKYALDNLAETARITSHDIAFWTGRNAGSTYSLGELDGTFVSMFQLLPQALEVALFRPYLWEVSNPLMLFVAIESSALFVFTLFALFTLISSHRTTQLINPHILFCLFFALSFAFAVGVSTFNFGTLSRYKIPMMPFYCVGISILIFQRKENTIS